jgi:hypothetical protein
MINGIICRNKLAGHPIDDPQWFSGLGSMMDQAKATTEVIEMVRKSNPKQTTNALVAAHEELKKAAERNDGQLASLINSIETFSQKVNDIAEASAKIGCTQNASATAATSK